MGSTLIDKQIFSPQKDGWIMNGWYTEGKIPIEEDR